MQQFLARPLCAAMLASTLLLAACGGGGGGGEGGFVRSSRLDNICVAETEKQWVRSYLDEVYLWSDEIVDVDAANYSNPADYFNALLVRTPDAFGLPKDRFSAVLPITAAQGVLQGVVKDHTDTVPITRVMASPEGRRTGYVLFNDFATGAQDDLIDAFRQLREGDVQDLVLDLRDNSGGFLYIAQALASMITGPAANGKRFEQLRYNAKRADETAESELPFSSRLLFAETKYPEGTRLPQLNLPRVYVLTSGATCSSSESVINGLRGIDVEVVLVGDTTCGKPYGFQRKDNCGFAYFPIEFKGANAKGFGDYSTGFTPTCRVEDDPAAPTGGARDPLLKAALHHIDNGSCPAASELQSDATPRLAPRRTPDRPAWAGRLLRDAR
ncbi:MAG TPA: S41 family peptidase [Ramlibacter sp.]